MARPSTRIELIKAILEIIERQGLTALTYESLSIYTGRSRSGLLYHFPSKEDMVAAAHEYAVQQRNAAAEEHLPGSFDDASPAERARAYILSTIEGQDATETTIYDYQLHGEFDERVWRELRDRWIDFTEGALSPAQHIAALAADGLWLDHGPDRPMSARTRAQIVTEVLELTNRAVDN